MKLRSIFPIFLYLFRILTLDYKFLRNKEKLLILVFHKVNDKKFVFHSPMPTATYEKICFFLRKHFEIIHFSDVDRFYKSCTNKKPAAIITFDDGLIDIKDNVLPFMNKFGIKFNVNIDTEALEAGLPQDFLKIYDILNATKPIEYLDSKYMKTPILIQNRVPIDVESEFTTILSNLSSIERRDFVQRMAINLCMDDDYYGVLSIDDIKILSKNPIIEFGSHTHTHPDLTKIPEDLVKEELFRSKQILSLYTNKEIEIIAYPNGQSNDFIDSLSINMNYKYLLKSGDAFTKMEDIKKCHFYRVNQYHSSVEVGIAHTLGVFRYVKKFLYG